MNNFLGVPILFTLALVKWDPSADEDLDECANLQVRHRIPSLRMTSTNSCKSFLNTIVIQKCSEDSNDPKVKQLADMVREDLHRVETPFNWFTDGGKETDNILYQRAVTRNILYTWESYLSPFVQKILQSYYAMCKNDKLVVIKCLKMAEKCIRKGEQSGNFKVLNYTVALRHVYAATVASVFYRCSMFTRARQYLDPITPLKSMTRQSLACIYFIRSLTLFYSGEDGHEEALRWAINGLRVDHSDPELRFLCLMLIYSLWNKEISPTLLDAGTFHLPWHFQAVINLRPATFENFYNATARFRKVSSAVTKMEALINRMTTETTSKEMNAIELNIVQCLEVEPHISDLIRFASHFFISTNQPEKAYFLVGIAKTVHVKNAYRWLDYRMLLYPETCDSEVFQTVLESQCSVDTIPIYKRIALHYVMYDPEKAFYYANKALALDIDQWLIKNAATGNYNVPIYDEKLTIFESTSGVGFYRFMIYYAHVLGSGEAARQYLWKIQEVLPSYKASTQFCPEGLRLIDNLLKNEFYRDPLKVPFRNIYQNAIIHCYDD